MALSTQDHMLAFRAISLLHSGGEDILLRIKAYLCLTLFQLVAVMTFLFCPSYKLYLFSINLTGDQTVLTLILTQSRRTAGVAGL